MLRVTWYTGGGICGESPGSLLKGWLEVGAVGVGDEQMTRGSLESEGHQSKLRWRYRVQQSCAGRLKTTEVAKSAC